MRTFPHRGSGRSGGRVRNSRYRTIPAASAAECTGENCPPPDGQGGHDCDREKQDQTTS